MQLIMIKPQILFQLLLQVWEVNIIINIIMELIYNKLIPFKPFAAINLFGFVFARKEYKPLYERTLNHERIHTEQMKEMLYIFFYLWYLIEWIVKLFIYGKKSYNNISFEREAYQYDRYADYVQFRKKYNWIKHL